MALCAAEKLDENTQVEKQKTDEILFSLKNLGGL